MNQIVLWRSPLAFALLKRQWLTIRYMPAGRYEDHFPLLGDAWCSIQSAAPSNFYNRIEYEHLVCARDWKRAPQHALVLVRVLGLSTRTETSTCRTSFRSQGARKECLSIRLHAPTTHKSFQASKQFLQQNIKLNIIKFTKFSFHHIKSSLD